MHARNLTTTGRSGTIAGPLRSGRVRPFRDPLVLLLIAVAAATAFFAVLVSL